MANITEKTPASHPSNVEIDALIAEARQLRARAVRDSAANAWSILRRAVKTHTTTAKASRV